MTDACIVCETEPIDDSDWYRCESTMEVVCPWCVKDMHNIKEMMKDNDPENCYSTCKLIKLMFD